MNLHPEIFGWGADEDPKDRPAVPKEHVPPPRGVDVHWLDPERQVPVKRELKAAERSHLPAVFGTAVPPSGASGLVRRLAFVWGENDLRHWSLLFLADRVNVFEGLVEDLAHGYVPNVFKELGWRAEFRFRPLRAIAKVGALALAVGAGAWLAFKPRRRR